MEKIGLCEDLAEVGVLELGFVLSEHKISAGTKRAKTVINKLKARAPLLVQRALYPNPSYPFLAHVYMMSSSGGILQGDRLSISIDAGQGTSAHITTQASTKIHKMENGYATQEIRISLHKGSYLEFTPRSTIPFKCSRFYQDTRISTDTESVLLYSETLSAGRIASGERFDFDEINLRVTAHDLKQRLLFLDNAKMKPVRDTSDENQAEFGSLFGRKDILSSLYLLVPPNSTQKLADQIERIIVMSGTRTQSGTSTDRLSDENNSLIAGWSVLPNESGLLIRMLSNSIDRVETVISDVAKVCRRQFLDRSSGEADADSPIDSL